MTRKTRIQPMEPAAEPEIDENGYDRPSKSQLKREMHALQELGEALIALPKDALKRMPKSSTTPCVKPAASPITKASAARSSTWAA
jgi:ribosomal 50S subunit-associated protein YjgA (DUF615 family)